jgi:plasmid stability protein
MAQVLVRGLDQDTVERLRKRAKSHGRSLQAELKEILERASRVDMLTARQLADRIRQSLDGQSHSDSATLVAEDRAR